MEAGQSSPFRLFSAFVADMEVGQYGNYTEKAEGSCAEYAYIRCKPSER